MINQTEEWLYKKAKEVDSELELQDLYTSNFMFGGSWVMDLLEEYHKEQLILSGVSKSLNASLQIDTKVKWKNVKGHIHKVLGGGFYEIRDTYDGHIWQGHKDSIEVID